MSQASRYAQGFQMHRAALIDLYERLPGDQGQFAAWDGGLTFIGLADHLSGSAARIPAMLQGQQAPAPAAPSATLGDALARLRTTHEAFSTAVLALSDEDLHRRVPALGQELPIGAVLDFMTQHEAHHKGQAWMMARMVGVVPGMFVKRG